jgi:hypothetical protein
MENQPETVFIDVRDVLLEVDVADMLRKAFFPEEPKPTRKFEDWLADATEAIEEQQRRKR